MKTLEQIKDCYSSTCVDGRDSLRLAAFYPESELADLGVTMLPGKEGTHTTVPYTREAVLAQLEKDVAFGFEKALDQRGISASSMYQVVKMWLWILEEGLEDFDVYAQYGLPLFKAVAVKYGFPNPIGEDTGGEPKYAYD